MSPRTYRMGKRAPAVEETRLRIRAAALAEYASTGIDAASTQSIAHRADVAPGTVLYHYPDPQKLAEDVMERRIEDLVVPTAAAISPGATIRERIAWLTGEMFRVYAATDLEYRAWIRSREHPVMRHYELWYNQVYTAALATALGPEHSAPRTFQVVSALIDPGFRAALLARGLSDDEAVETASALVLAWLESGDASSHQRFRHGENARGTTLG